MNDKWTGITLGWIMHPPQPDFKICQRTVPAGNLNENSKRYTRDMNPFNPFIPPAYKCAKNQKYNPEEMEEDNDVCGYWIKHYARKCKGGVTPPLQLIIKRQLHIHHLSEAFSMDRAWPVEINTFHMFLRWVSFVSPEIIIGILFVAVEHDIISDNFCNNWCRCDGIHFY